MRKMIPLALLVFAVGCSAKNPLEPTPSAPSATVVEAPSPTPAPPQVPPSQTPVSPTPVPPTPPAPQPPPPTDIDYYDAEGKTHWFYGYEPLWGDSFMVEVWLNERVVWFGLNKFYIVAGDMKTGFLAQDKDPNVLGFHKMMLDVRLEQGTWSMNGIAGQGYGRIVRR